MTDRKLTAPQREALDMLKTGTCETSKASYPALRWVGGGVAQALIRRGLAELDTEARKKGGNYIKITKAGRAALTRS